MNDTPSYLPTYHTNLIGRAAERQAVTALLQDPARRLVTLVGDSGAGKTRLALEVAAAEATAFPGGVVFVPLAPVLNPDLVLSTIAHQLGIQEQPQEPLEQTLISQLAERAVLLVLDNFEQVLAAGAGLQRILDATSGPKIVVTSQQPLDVPAEQVYQIPPLQVPSGSAAELDLATLAVTPAVQLFVDRMQHVQPQFQLTAQNAPAVLEICRLVRGFPLAIELVAAHSATFSPNDLVLFLRTHLTVRPFRRSLTGSSSREDILGPVLDWCYARLNPAAQQLFQRLGVFLGGWTDEAAAAVCGVPGDGKVKVVGQLGLLVEKHLVQEETLPGRERRYLLLDAVREYTQRAAAKTAEWEHVQAQHAQYYSTLANQFEQEFGKAAQASLELVEGDIHNLRAAMGWYVANGDMEAAIGMYGALYRFWLVRGYFTEVRTQLRPLLESLAPNVGGEAAAKAWKVLGVMAAVQSDATAAITAYEESLRRYEALGDLNGQAALQNNMAVLAAELGDFAVAEERYQKSLAAAQANTPPNPIQIGDTINNLGNIYLHRGDLKAAEEAYAQSITICHNEKYIAGEIISISNRGLIAQYRGQYEQAVSDFQQALDESQRLNYAQFIVVNSLHLAGAALDQGDQARAKTHIQKAYAQAKLSNQPLWVAFAQLEKGFAAIVAGDRTGSALVNQAVEELESLGELESASIGRLHAARAALEWGTPAEARDYLRSGLAGLLRYQYRLWLFRGLELWAYSLIGDKDFAAAARLLAAAEAERKAMGVVRVAYEHPLHDQACAALQKALGHERLAAAQTIDTPMPVESLIHQLLEQPA